VFDAPHSRRGEPGHDNRGFPGALHYFIVHTIASWAFTGCLYRT
jgi:hypothetical protein